MQTSRFLLLAGALTAISGCSGEPADDTPSPSPSEQSPTPVVTPTTPPSTPTAIPITPTEQPETPTATPDTPTPASTPFPPVEYAPEGPIEVRLDTWGTPHIYASTDADAVWAQGYMHARDRMWHMDFNRRVAGGRISELLGEGYYEVDLLYRALDFKSLTEIIWNSLQETDPELSELLEAYAAGANAYLDDAIRNTNGASLSPQVEALGYIPEPWHPRHTLMIDKLLIFNLSTSIEIDLAVSLVSQAIGTSVAADLIRPQPVEPTVIVPNFYGSSTPTVSPGFGPAPLEPWELTPERRAKFLKTLDKLRQISDLFQGSNNWVVGPEHTYNGAPLIANDTHEGVEAPATYYRAHLNSLDQGGSLDVMGYNFPGVPLVAFGHNRYAAWAVTNNFADVNEIFQERVVGNNAVINGQQVPIEKRTETIRVRQDGKPVEDGEERLVEMQKVPPHGPVLPRELAGDLPVTLSVAWTGFNNVNSMEVLLGMAQARQYTDFEAALRTFKVGGQNFLFANVDGDYGYSARTNIPLRANLSPSCAPIGIVPGTGECEWTGSFVADEDIPQTRNPSRGFVVSANNEPAGLLQDNNPYNEDVYLSSVYDNGLRAYRIEELLQEILNAGDTVDVEDFQRIQGDTQVRLALRLVPYLIEAADNRPDLVTGDVADAIALMRAWTDYNSRLESGAPVVFHTWLGWLFRAVFEDETFPELFDDLSNDYVNMLCRPLIYFLDKTKDSIDEIEAGQSSFPSASLLNYFDNQDTDVLETRDEVLLRSFADAVNHLLLLSGPVASWKWGDVHTITFNDKAQDYLPEASTGPYQMDGALFTVDPAEFRVTSGGIVSNVFDITGGPSQRTIYTVKPDGIEIWDVQPGGASERPDDPHFMDQASMYVNNTYFKRAFTRAEVEAATEQVLNF